MEPDDLRAERATVHRSNYSQSAFHVTGEGPVPIDNLPGRLIVLEGTDGVGRSTHIALLREALENLGYGVMHTGLVRSRLAGEGVRRAKRGTTATQRTLDLLYATDFADRLENEILPALRAGFVVLTDRYIFSIIARSMVRGTDFEWLKDLYRYAPIPHGVMYLKVDVPNLIPRVTGRGVFDYWESGLDFQEEMDVFRSFTRYQERLLKVFDELARIYNFDVLDANRDIADVFADVKAHTIKLLEGMRDSGA
jgi:dTMP kinase